MMEEKKKLCPGCKRPLPEGYKHLYCESCRTKHADNTKKAGKAALGIAGIVLTVFAAGKFNSKNL